MVEIKWFSDHQFWLSNNKIWQSMYPILTSIWIQISHMNINFNYLFDFESIDLGNHQFVERYLNYDWCQPMLKPLKSLGAKTLKIHLILWGIVREDKGRGGNQRWSGDDDDVSGDIGSHYDDVFWERARGGHVLRYDLCSSSKNMDKGRGLAIVDRV